MTVSILEALSGSRIKSRVIYWLYVNAVPGEGVTERGLARRLGIPAGSIHKALLQLVEGQLIVRKNTIHGPEYHAPHDDPRLKPLFLLLRQDSEITEQLRRALKRFTTVDYACIFGSFAKGDTHARSDIDVLVLERADAQRMAVMTALGKISDKIGREVSPQFYKTSEFGSLIEAGEPIALSILSSPRIELKGELSWPR